MGILNYKMISPRICGEAPLTDPLCRPRPQPTDFLLDVVADAAHPVHHVQRSCGTGRGRRRGTAGAALDL